MNHTPLFDLSQWEKSDRIQMEDFNSDNLKIENALGRKLELVELMDVSKTLTGETIWRPTLTFSAGDYLALFFEFKVPTMTQFTPYTHTTTAMYDLQPPYAVVAYFPLRNPDLTLAAVPLSGINGTRQVGNYAYRQMQAFTMTRSSGMTGTHSFRVLGII